MNKKELERIFGELKKIMKNYSPPFSVKEPSSALKRSGKKSFELESVKDVVIAGRPRKNVYFAGLIINKDYVGFYYMLAYAESEVRDMLSPEFLALLKGKSCFYIRSTDKWVLDQVRKALEEGVTIYKEKEWL
jgi:hypothetical protein